ncbi:hypothetical protein Lal_00022484, partial [Lupinus albus]
GLDHIPISPLQFAGDAIIIGDCSARSIWALKGVLKLFELSYGLKINYSKSSLFGVNIKDAQLNSIVVSLYCKLSAKSFTYLGIPIGFSSPLAKQSSWVRDLDFSQPTESRVVHWFWGGMVCIVGDGSNTSFWHDNWIGSSNLFSRYRRLYNLCHSPFVNVSSLGNWVGDKWVVLFCDKSNGWEWKFDKLKQYPVKSSYYSITSSMEPKFSPYPYQLLWKSMAPLKVLSFAWRLFQDRIPTKDALLRRGVSLLNGGGATCSLYNNHFELIFPTSFLFLFFDLFCMAAHIGNVGKREVLFGLLLFGQFGFRGMTLSSTMLGTIHFKFWMLLG